MQYDPGKPKKTSQGKRKNCKNKGKYAFLLGTLGTPPRCIANTGFVVGKTQILLGTALGTVGTD